MPLAELSGFLGANLKVHKRFLPPGVGVLSLNQRPSDQGDLRPWRDPLTISTPSIGASRLTVYRMGRDVATPGSYWLSFTGVAHIIRAFDASDPTERTYFTTSNGVPQWTDNIQALTAAPYPNATRLLAVPKPTIAPTVTLSVDGATGDTRRLSYVFTWVNDIDWESAPSPPFLAPTAKPGAVLNLSTSESVPAGNYGVNRLRWYRTQVIAGTANDVEYMFIREYAIGAGGMQDDARTTIEILATATWLPLSSDARWLTDCWNQFASALVGKTVRFCVPNYVYAWPIALEYIVAAKPIAQAAFAQRLLVFTEAGAELFTGSDPEAMDQKPMRLAIIVSQRSLVVGESFCIWAARDGLWYWGTDGYRCLTENIMTPEQWAALVPLTIAGYYLAMGGRVLYVGFYNDGSGLKGFVVDPTNPAGMYFLSTGYAAGYWDPMLRALFVLDGTTIKQWDAGATFMTAQFRGKVNRQPADTEGEWLELLAEGTATVKVLVDAATPFNRTVATGEHRLPNGTEGRDWQLEVSTTGSVQAALAE